MNYAQLVENIKAKRSFLCVGLDTDLEKMPECVRTGPEPLYAFTKAIVDATAPYTVAYKPNFAFYEAYGGRGIAELERIVYYIRSHYPDVFLIADAKRGDIDNTSAMYAKSVFELMGFDACTLSPYMGCDTVKPFLNFNDKWSILLALTSNPSAADFQLMEDAQGEKLYEKVLKTSKQWGSINNLMYVVGATQAKMLEGIRKIVPQHFLLIPGVGAQGGSLDEVAQYGMNENCGLLVNSSRAIIYADKGERYAEVAGEKAKEVQQQMHGLLKKKGVING